MSDPVAVRTLVARFVTETCQAARKRERARASKEEEERNEAMEEAPVRIYSASQTSKSRQQRSELAHPHPLINTATACEADANLQFKRIPSSRAVTLRAAPEIRKKNTYKVEQGNGFRTVEMKDEETEVVLPDGIEETTGAKNNCHGDDVIDGAIDQVKMESGLQDVIKKDINPFGDSDSDE